MIKRAMAAFFTVAVMAALAGATTVIPMSVEQLTHASSNVVRARAARSWSEWNPQHTAIFTYTQFAIESQLKGTAPATLVVKQPGGIVGGTEQKVSGVRQFAGKERTVLFLRPSIAADGTMVVVGLMQGHFRVEQTAEGAVASNGVPDVKAYNSASGTVSAFEGGRMPLRELEQRVRKAVEQ